MQIGHPHVVRARALKRLRNGDRASDICHDERIDKGTLRRWAKKERSKPSSSLAEGVTTVEDKGSVDLPRGSENKTILPEKSIVLACPDLHAPFQHPDSIPFLKAVKARFKPNTYVFLGDECDFAAFSSYDHDPDGMSPGKELEAAIEALIPFYREFPDAMVCESNHTVRPLKLGFKAGLPAAFLPTYSTMLNAPDGWRWQQYWNVDGVRYHHGDSGRSGQFAPAAYLKAFKQSHVHGHLHSHASVLWKGPYFGVNAGCLIDPTAYAFKYARNHAIPVNLGCALIFNGQSAHFLPLHQDRHGRWTGKL